MKQLSILLLALSCLLCLSACSETEEPVVFYYPKTAVAYHSDTGVLSPETRETLSRDDSLGYLLSFYLEGPTDPNLRLPVPEGTQVLRLIPYDGGVLLVMSREFSQLEGIDLTIACSGISKTCFDLTDLQEITFSAGTQKNVLRIVHRDSIILTDTVTKPPNEPKG